METVWQFLRNIENITTMCPNSPGLGVYLEGLRAGCGRDACTPRVTQRFHSGRDVEAPTRSLTCVAEHVLYTHHGMFFSPRGKEVPSQATTRRSLQDRVAGSAGHRKTSSVLCGRVCPSCRRGSVHGKERSRWLPGAGKGKRKSHLSIEFVSQEN